jgi:hypothetical protein
VDSPPRAPTPSYDGYLSPSPNGQD